jgi:hypothetical protein
VRGGRAYGDGDGFGGFGRGEHVAAAVEYGTGFHDQAGRMDFARDDGLGLNLNFAGRFYGAVEMAADDDVIAFNLAFHFGVLAEDQGLVGNQRPLHCRINAKSARAFQATFELDALVEKASPLPGIMSFAVEPTHAASLGYVNSVPLIFA